MLIWDMRYVSSRRGVLIAKLCQKWLTERASFSYHFYKLLRERSLSLISQNSDDILFKKKFDIQSWKYTYSNFHFGYIRRPIKAKTSCFDFIRSQNIPLSLSFQSQNVAQWALNPSYFQNCIIKITFPYQNTNHSQLNHAKNKVSNKVETKTKIFGPATGINPYQSLN